MPSKYSEAVEIGSVISAALFAIALVLWTAQSLSLGTPQLAAIFLILLAALVALFVLRTRRKNEQLEEWKESLESFRDNLGRVSAFLKTAGLKVFEHHQHQNLPGEWSELANMINWPLRLRDWPLRLWPTNMTPMSPAVEAVYRIAHLAYTNQWDGHVEFDKARRDMTRTVISWVEWGRGDQKEQFREFITPHLTKWRSALIMLAYLEIVLAAEQPLSHSIAGDWADLGSEWRSVFYRASLL
jgi:hypothetical protein